MSNEHNEQTRNDQRRAYSDVSQVTSAVQDLTKSILSLTQSVDKLRADLLQGLAGLRVENDVVKSRPIFDAGPRLIQVTELLEGILMHLPSRDLLLAQGVNQQFRHTILRYETLQQNLFLRNDKNSLATSPVVLNPLVTTPQALRRLPLYLDPKEGRLAYISGTDRCRVFGRLARVMTNPTMISLEFSDRPGYQDSFSAFYAAPPAFGPGSWRSMSLSQPICRIAWHVVIHLEREVHLYDCITSGAGTIDGLLDIIAATTLQHTQLRTDEYRRRCRNGEYNDHEQMG